MFQADHPLAQLVKSSGARLSANPNALVSLIPSGLITDDESILGFIRSEGSQVDLVPIALGEGEEEFVGIILRDEGSEPVVIEGGQKIAVLPVSAVIEFIHRNVTQESATGQKSETTEKTDLVNPIEIQQLQHALSVQSPNLGNLVIKPNDLDPKLFTVHQEGSEANGLTAVSMHGVYGYSLNKKDKIHKNKSTRHIVGYYLADESEFSKPKNLVNKLGRMKKALARQKSSRETSAGYGIEEEINIAVITPDQLSVWQKEKYFTELVAYKDGAASLKQVFDIFSGQLNSETQIQVQHVTNGEADLVFVPSGARLPSELSVFDVEVSMVENGPVVIERVVGAICVPDGMSENEKKTLAKRVSNTLRLLYTGKNLNGKIPTVLVVDNTMLEFWKGKISKGETILKPHAPKNLAENKLGLVEKALGGSSDVEKVDFYTFEPDKPGIGAKFMQIVVTYGDGHEERLTLDHGAQFDNFPWDGMSKPSFAQGLSPFLDFIPQNQSKLWRRTILLKEAEHQGKRFFVPENALASDLAMRIGMEQFTALASGLGYDNAEVDLPALFTNESGKKTHQIGVVYTHAHIDHIGFGGLLSTNIPVITTDEAIPFFETLFLTGGGGHAGEAIFRRERQTPLTNRSNRVFTPPLFLPEPFKEIRLGRGQVGVTLLPASHSIYGGAMVKVVVYDQADKPVKTIVYSGDYNFDDSQMMMETEQHLQDVDVLITDTTNIRPDAYNKPSVGVTREMMRAGFREALQNADNSTIVQLAWNNVADLDLIQKIASEIDKDVYVYPKMALLLYLLHELDEARLKHADIYNWRAHNPVPRLGEKADVLPWSYPKMTMRKGERMLQEMMDVATHADLASATPHVLFAPPNPMLFHTMAGAQHSKYSQVIRAHYWPYRPYDKVNLRKDMRYARERGMGFLADVETRSGNIYPSIKPKFHMSGHARPESTLAMINRLASRGSLKQVIPIHGDSRQYAADAIRSQGDQLIVYERFKKRGHTISLYAKN